MIVSVWILAFAYVEFEQQEEIRQVREHNSNLAVAFEQYVIGTLRRAEMLTQLVADEYRRAGAQLNISTGMAERAVASGDASAYAIVDENGKVLASSQPDAWRANHNNFKDHLANTGNGVVIGKPLASPAAGGLVIPVWRALIRADGSVGGIVVVHLKPGHFTEFYRSASLGGADMIGLVGLDGIARARRIGKTESSGDDISASPLFMLLSRQSTGHYVGPSLVDKVIRHYTYRRLERYPLVVVAATAEADVLRAVHARRTLYFGAATFLTVLVSLLGTAMFTAYRRQQRMLDTITESEERFRALGDVLPQLIWVSRRDGTTATYNQRWFDFTGQSPDASTGDGWQAYVHPEELARVGAAWQRSVREELPYEVEYRLRRHDGEYRWILARAIPMRNDSGQVIQWVGTCTDIAEQKQAVAAVQEAQRFAQATIDALSKHIAVLDASGCILTVNKAWREFAQSNGAAPEAACEGANYLHVCDRAAAAGDADAQRVGDMLRHVAVGRLDSANYEYACHSAQSQHWYSLTITRFDDKLPARVVVAHSDITVRKLAEEKVRDSEARFKSISANIPGVVFEMRRRDGVVSLTYVSEGTREVLGLAPDSLSADPPLFPRMLDQDSVESFRRSMAESEKALSVWNWEGQFRPTGEPPKWINLRATPRLGEDGGVVWDGVVFNITRSKEYEASLLESQRLQQELSVRQLAAREEERTRIAREIHDELGQRLTALRMDTLMLPKTLDDPSPALRVSVGKMRDAIDGILRIVRNIAAELRPPVLDIGIVMAIEWLVEEFQARSKVHAVFRNEAGNAVQLDDEQATGVFRILQESLTNIARHAHATRVEVRLFIADEAFFLHVIDNGIGFHNQDARPAKSYGLVGMQERAAMLKGDLSIDSTPGKGTTVRFCLPLSEC